ncbi:hypothetical protein MRB53_023108 [Persea americana]|uniref:Uncharacterized protein n=1 Tax=Persea americana TaxID=3435 RepID=A0ACC2L8U8_PERAE|nr:hypothetical protein MRB53_023108 [Persea americana]
MANEVVSHLLIRCSEWLGIELLQAYDVDDKVRSLKQTLEWVHAFLVDADKINYCQSSERAKLWVRQIVDRAHEAEDAVDNFTYIAEQCKTWNASKIVRDPRRRVAKNIDKIVKAMNETILNRSLFGIENLPVGGGIASASLGVEEEEEQVQVACVVAEEEDVVHMDDDTSLLAEVLIQETAERRHLVSIVGMAGIEPMSPTKARRLVIKPDGSGKYIYLIKSAPTHFRSLFSFCQTHTIIEKDVCKFICGFKFLRILHLHSLSISHGSLDGIENLILLKYLGLMHSHRVIFGNLDN